MANIKVKLLWHKFLHWEYWSVYVVYAPTFFLWVYYAIKLRSLSFYKYSNPAMKNGGFFDVSKMEIYNLLPKALYPKTILITDKEVAYSEILTDNSLFFPLIVKPDRGYRGIMVRKVNTIEELETYAAELNDDFLIQEVVNYPNELGLFYCRMPNQNVGEITGITLKKFLTIKGDGFHSMEYFIKQNKRYLFQLDKLQTQYDLSKVLENNEEVCLVPFGNHNRGTAFLDGSYLISEQLTATFDYVLNKIEGFYYGRLDIRYHTIDDLLKGKNFKIIELNGAMSEPTHIYDPKNSFYKGQKEIFRHQAMFFDIIKLNLKSDFRKIKEIIS